MGAQADSACRKSGEDDVAIPDGHFLMGAGNLYPEEGPPHEESVGPFSIDRYAVTNAQFARFVAATGYVTDAERKPDPADYPEADPKALVAGGAVFRQPAAADLDDPMQWWQIVPGANWQHPEGPDSSIEGRGDYPVVQVSYNDALAYAHWLGRDLPTEIQMEYAARGGLDGKKYAWGDEFTPGSKPQANTWQGKFPVVNTGADGFPGLAPVGCFPPNGYGLYDMIGNVWEWSSTLYQPVADQGHRPNRALRVIKGGSFLCAPNYCFRYRPAARESQESGFSSSHLGFRTVGNRSKWGEMK